MRILRYALLVILLLLAGAAGSEWWMIHRALPVTDGTALLAGLQQTVTADRDAWGVPHIQAHTLEDLVEAQGYVEAQDRLWQMDVLRRVGAGELSEIFGPATLELDRQSRTLGLRQVADREAANLDANSKMVLEAFARGVNRFIEGHTGRLPVEFVALRYQPKPWKAADSLLIAGYMFEALTNMWPKEINRDFVTNHVDAAHVADMYAEDSPDDHVVVGGVELPGAKHVTPDKKQSKRIATTISKRTSESAAPMPIERITDLWDEARNILTSFSLESHAANGSNNWVVDGTHTATGKPILANDTHLDLTMPSIWYMVHLTAPGWNVKGFSLPGTPLVIIGHNDQIAWGFTNNGADVQDLYVERFDQDKPREYLVNGKFVEATYRTERIKVRGQNDVVFDVVSTRHGPIVRRELHRAYALRWTALEPGALSHGYLWMGRAKNWQEFRETLRGVSGPAQNVVYADVNGNIGFLVAAWIPIRKSGHGEVPVPGDTDEYEWNGHIPFDELPQTLNPPGGIIVTANARVVGPNYKHYVTDRWESPYRTRRIYDLLANRKDLRPSDMNAIQNDIVALNDKSLADALVHAADVAKPKDSRTSEIITRLKNWDGSATVNSVQTSFVEVTRDSFIRSMLEPFLSANADLYQWRGSVLIDRILRDRPPMWLPPSFRTYDEMLIASADQAVAVLETTTHGKDIDSWQIGKLNALTINHPLGRSKFLHPFLSIGPLEQPGTAYTPRAMTHTHGPAMRFVADLSNWDQSLMEISSGESGEFGSAHYKDQFPEWFAGRSIPSSFSAIAEEKARVHHLTLVPDGVPDGVR